MPTYPRPKDFLIYEGRSFTAEWYFTTTGRMPAYEYYRSLPEKDQEKLDKMIKHFCDRPFGTMIPKQHYRIEDSVNKIYAFKPRDERYFNFMTAETKVVITNAYHKHSQQMGRIDREQLNTAVWYREDYLRRVMEANYYGK